MYAFHTEIIRISYAFAYDFHTLLDFLRDFRTVVEAHAKHMIKARMKIILKTYEFHMQNIQCI